MGAEFSKSKYIYWSDDGVGYIVGLRDEVATLGNFEVAPEGPVCNLPKTYRMRYVLGFESGTGNAHKQPVAKQADPLMSTQYQFVYLGRYFQVGAVVSEKRHGKY